MEGGVLEIEGDKPKCTWYHINDGYFYIPSSSGANHLYLKCKISRCKGRATMPKNKDERTFENFKVTVSHSHDPDFNQLTLQNLRRRIMDRCSTEETPFLTIWNEETARIDAQVMTELEGRISFKSLTCSMKRARNSQQSKPPTTLHEYGVALLKSLKYLKTVRDSDFYLSMVESDEGGVSVIFGSPEFMELLPGVEELHLDGTFNVRPMKSLSFHMLTIMTMHLSSAFPVFFILMEKTNEAAYTDVFRFMKKRVPSLNPSVFITDFKSTLQDCLSKEFPGKEIVGSWFHAAMDMRRKAAELGLFHFLRESPMVKMILKMVMALPLLPSKNIANGYDVITEFALEKGVYDRMERFLQYVDRTWIKGVGSERLSVYRQEHRTINHQCSFHNSLSHLMNGAHPNVWRFTESLKMTENLKYEKYKSMLQRSDSSSKSVTNILQYPRIQQALHLLDDERTTVLGFLQKVSHCFDSIVDIELFRDEDVIDTLDIGKDEGGQLVENVPIVVEIGDENQEESQENESLTDGDIKIGDFKMVEMDADVLEIPGQKPNSTWYHANDGYFYLLRNSDKSRLYLKCKDSKCRGRASMPVERRLLETFRITVPHSHGPDFHQLPLLELRRKILERCSKEVTPLLTIWNEEMTKVEPHLLSALEGRFTYKSLKSSMHRARALQQLEIPPNLQEYGVALLNTKSQKTLRGSDFYMATIESADGGASVIFGSPELIDLLPGVEELHLDGTFSVRQLEPPFQKMLTIMLIHMSHALPVFFILMEKNNEAAYTDVINFIKSKVPSLNPSVFITDFDKAIQKCLSKEFPGRKIVGSWFHVAMVSFNNRIQQISCRGLIALPVFFILMEKNNEAAYTDVINFIKSKVPSLNPSVFITDFDKAIQKCLSKEFPGRKIVGSWFHVAMDMRKKAGELGLSHLLRESQMAKKVLKMAMTLPLLPSHKIVDGFDVITEFAFEKRSP
ncbi:uncharacterized protein LOC111064492 [Nilaparvata lugens]|uniref:uncharacterized protein LOC111064492 n=1 Tax=Nilaparvata lugens TaxID=108931 RepID=UPI00193CA311|nr:uncharacterized protein LOC111064492 [Nilaparvata lugens]